MTDVALDRVLERQGRDGEGKNILFHDGERAVHERMGVNHAFDMDDIAEPGMPAFMSQFLAALPYLAGSPAASE
jgi:hypothetical protein